MLINESLIVAAAFVVLVAMSYRMIKSGLISSLDSYRKEVSKSINESEEILKQAKALFEQAQDELNQAKKTAQDIIDASYEDAKLVLEEAKQNIKAVTDKKTQLALSRIELHEKQVFEELKERAVNMAFSRADELMSKELNHELRMGYFNSSLTKVKRNIH